MTHHAVAALGTLQDGAPCVSMVPFALADDGHGLIVHVSRLAAHTENMMHSPQVSLLVMESEGPDKLPQSLARVTVQGLARALADSDDQYGPARDAYLLRFPDAAGLFEFPDFSLFLIEVTRVRVVGGFAQATTLTPAAFASALVEHR